MRAYYNDSDLFAAAWLTELIAGGHIMDGDVDNRPIQDVSAGDLAGYTRCHFFAGIGGWDYALQLAGWPDDVPVWTGSCPCQPFSAAGKRRGEADERHLWPEFARLIGECQPATVFGEQVASPLGRQWLSGVFADLEDVGYAAAGADLCAAGVGSPSIGQRLFWLASAECNGRDGWRIGEPLSAGNSGTVSSPVTYTGHPGWDASRWVVDSLRQKRRFPLGYECMADGIRGSVATLRGYGNAIVSQVAAEFIGAYMQCQNAANT